MRRKTVDVDVEKMSNKELADVLYDWTCGMANSFNGTPYPKDFPRFHMVVKSYKLQGKHLAFFAFKDYCKTRGIEL